jgi:uncharacterized membrane protein
MTSEEIAASVTEIANAIIKDNAPKPGDMAAILAGVMLITNLLQNINTIAMAAKNGSARYYPL